MKEKDVYMNMKDLKILFLAKFAPKNGTNYPLSTEENDGIYAQYHFDIYKILKSIFPNTVCANSPDILINQPKKFDYVFSLLNRAPYKNSEIFISALLEYQKTPYLGTTPNIRALAEDKHLAKIVASYSGLHTPNWITVDANGTIPSCEPFDGPYFIKPRFGASSAFIDENSIAYDWQHAKIQIQILQRNNLDVIIEEFVNGTYYSLPVYFSEDTPIFLPAVKEESNLKGNVVTYRQKRKLDQGLNRVVNKNDDLTFKLNELSSKFFQMTSPLDYTRIDYIVTKNAIEFIEFNICCNLGKQSSFCVSANSVGLTQYDLVKQILINSLKRQKVII